tara:strand:- start:2060 stop:2299 length:240 start_codon:yes stop_codon:yes gene_type:complete
MDLLSPSITNSCPTIECQKSTAGKRFLCKMATKINKSGLEVELREVVQMILPRAILAHFSIFNVISHRKRFSAVVFDTQ